MTDLPNFDADDLPDLDTVIGVYGAATQREIGGEICINVAVAISLYHHN